MDFQSLSKGKRLRTDADLQNAIWFQSWVDIYRHGHLIDYGGVIEKFDEDSVAIMVAITFVQIGSP